MTSAPPNLNIPDAPVAEVQQLRADYTEMDINVELWGLTWVFVARSRGGRDPWFLASDSLARFRNALARASAPVYRPRPGGCRSRACDRGRRTGPGISSDRGLGSAPASESFKAGVADIQDDTTIVMQPRHRALTYRNA